MRRGRRQGRDGELLRVSGGAGDQVVVGEAGCLHERVYDRGAHQPEPPPHHVLAYRLRF